MLAAVGAGDRFLLDIVHHLLVGPAGNVGAVKVFDQVVSPVAGVTFFTVHQRIGEAAEVSRGDPSLGIHQDRGVQTHVILSLLYELFEPCFFDIVLQLGAERTVVPSIGETAVDFGAGIYKTSAFA